MRTGFTTGSCSAAAAKAAAYMLLSGKRCETIDITTPRGIVFHAQITQITACEDRVRCGVVKDGGDDPDVTTGSVILAEVTRTQGPAYAVQIEGGEGVGRVTSPGLDQPVGSAAINSVPRKMITDEVQQVMHLLDCPDALRVTIHVPGGEALAQKTFNPRLGIVGGISILGTSGIVEPMSEQALKDTIRVELRQKHALGLRCVAAAPGNYGMDFMRERFGFDLDRAVKCSNYIGDTIDMAAELGLEKLLLIGHVGKLIKLAGGIMNTHSKEADCRMELMAACALRADAGAETACRILACLNTDEGWQIVKDCGLADAAAREMMQRIHASLNRRAAQRLQVECIVFSKVHGLLGMTDGAAQLLEEMTND